MVLALFCAVLAGYGVSRLAADDASASPASADATTQSDESGACDGVEGSGECPDEDDPCVKAGHHLGPFNWETKDTCSCKMGKISFKKYYPVGEEITIHLDNPQKNNGQNQERCSACRRLTGNLKSHKLSSPVFEWSITHNGAEIAKGPDQTAKFTPLEPSVSKDDYKVTFTVKEEPNCEVDKGPNCSSVKCEDAPKSANFTLVGVKFILTYPKTLVEGRARYKSMGYPENIFDYKWKTRKFSGNAHIDPMEMQAVIRVSKPSPAKGTGGTVIVKYGPAKDKFENAKITVLDGAYTAEDKRITQVSQTFTRNSHGGIWLFNHIYIYYLYDQYKKSLRDSHFGGSKPMIKEKFGYHRAYSGQLAKRLRKALKKYSQTNWSVRSVGFGDHVAMKVYPDDFRYETGGDYFPDIRNGKTVFEVRNHIWMGSVNKKFVKNLTNNHWKGIFINVKRKKPWFGAGKKIVSSFKIRTFYKIRTKYNN